MKRITATERVIAKMIREGVKVNVPANCSYSMDYEKAITNIANFIVMLADTNLILKVK